MSSTQFGYQDTMNGSLTPVRDRVLSFADGGSVKQAGAGFIAGSAIGGGVGGAVRGGVAGLSLGVILNALLKDEAKAKTVYELLKRAKPWAIGGAAIGGGLGAIGGGATAALIDKAAKGHGVRQG